MNLQEELKAIKERIAELEVLAKGEQEFPKVGDKYWYIDTTGDVHDENWECFSFEKATLEIGNVFSTKEQAEFAVEKLKVEAELRSLSDSWDLEKTQYTFSFNWEVGEFEIDYPDYNQYPGSYYFDSLDSWEQAIESVGEERIKKYIFEVE